MHFPPVSDFPYFLNFIFSRKSSPFSSAKISDDLSFSHRPQISNFLLLFSLFQYISPLFRENYYFTPAFKNFPPAFRKIHLLFTWFLCISFPPYFEHDAFMHHPMHALDVPGCSSLYIGLSWTLWTALGALLPALFLGDLNLTICYYLPICMMSSTG